MYSGCFLSNKVEEVLFATRVIDRFIRTARSLILDFALCCVFLSDLDNFLLFLQPFPLKPLRIFSLARLLIDYNPIFFERLCFRDLNMSHLGRVLIFVVFSDLPGRECLLLWAQLNSKLLEPIPMLHLVSPGHHDAIDVCFGLNFESVTDDGVLAL